MGQKEGEGKRRWRRRRREMVGRGIRMRERERVKGEGEGGVEGKKRNGVRIREGGEDNWKVWIGNRGERKGGQ